MNDNIGPFKLFGEWNIKIGDVGEGYFVEIEKRTYDEAHTDDEFLHPKHFTRMVQTEREVAEFVLEIMGKT